MAPPIEFPEILYGEFQVVQEKWHAFARDTVADGEIWRKGLDQLRLVSVSDHPGAVLLNEQYGPSVPRERHWRLHVVREELNVLLPATFEERLAIARHQQGLVLDGASRFWFAIAMYISEHRMPAFLEEGPIAVAAFRLPLLRRLVYWIPEVCSISDRLAYGWGGDYPLLYYHQDSESDYWFHLWSFLLHLFWTCDLVGGDSVNWFWDRAKEEYDRDVVRALEGEGLIEKKNGRYYLNYPRRPARRNEFS